jgi:hypothetical protein
VLNAVLLRAFLYDGTNKSVAGNVVLFILGQDFTLYRIVTETSFYGACQYSIGPRLTV